MRHAGARKLVIFDEVTRSRPPTMHSSRAAPRPPSAARVSAGDANHLLSECYALFEARLLEMATSSLELAHDLFESHSHVPDGEVAAFLNKRGEWLPRFPKTLKEPFHTTTAVHPPKT